MTTINCSVIHQAAIKEETRQAECDAQLLFIFTETRKVSQLA